MTNIFEPEFDEQRDKPGFTAQRAWIGRPAGAQQLGASVWLIEPGEAAYPYHFHYGEEEMLIVLTGSPSLRTPEGWRDLKPGDVVAFPVGPEGAHQLMNRTDEQVRFLALSTIAELDGVEYPDSDKVTLAYRRGKPDGFRHISKRSEGLDYWDGETPPE